MTVPDKPSDGLTVGSALGALPVLGHAMELKRRPLDFLRSLPSQGDLVRIRLGPRTAYVVCHPELIHAVLTDARSYDKGGPIYDKLRQLLGNGLGTSMREPHQRQRRLVQSAFNADRLADYADMIVDETVAVLADWRDGQVVDAEAATYELISRVLATTMFRSPRHAAHAAEVGRWLPVFHTGVGARMTAPFGILEKLPTPANRRYGIARDRLHALVDDVIGSYRADGSGRPDLLSLLIDADDDGDRLSDQEIHEHIITILVAGVPTSAAVLAWALHFLGRDPGLSRRLDDELAAVLPATEPGPRFEDLGKLPLTGRIFTEVMRYYPPGWMLSRVAMKDTVLAGQPVRKGSVVLFSPYLVHHNPAVYDDPERFDVDRWPAGRIHSDTYVPFGAGSRKCIGDQYGETELALILATLHSRWHLEPLPRRRDEPLATAVIRPGPLPMRLHART